MTGTECLSLTIFSNLYSEQSNLFFLHFFPEVEVPKPSFQKKVISGLSRNNIVQSNKDMAGCHARLSAYNPALTHKMIWKLKILASVYFRKHWREVTTGLWSRNRTRTSSTTDWDLLWSKASKMFSRRVNSLSTHQSAELRSSTRRVARSWNRSRRKWRILLPVRTVQRISWKIWQVKLLKHSRKMNSSLDGVRTSACQLSWLICIKFATTSKTLECSITQASSLVTPEIAWTIYLLRFHHRSPHPWEPATTEAEGRLLQFECPLSWMWWADVSWVQASLNLLVKNSKESTNSWKVIKS